MFLHALVDFSKTQCVSVTSPLQAQSAREAEMSYALICIFTYYDCTTIRHSANQIMSMNLVRDHIKASAENAGSAATAELDVLEGD